MAVRAFSLMCSRGRTLRRLLSRSLIRSTTSLRLGPLGQPQEVINYFSLWPFVHSLSIVAFSSGNDRDESVLISLATLIILSQSKAFAVAIQHLVLDWSSLYKEH